MTGSLVRPVLLAAAASMSIATGATAQSPDAPSAQASSLAGVQTRIPVGEVVHVTDASGTTIKGRLASVTADAVRVQVKSEVREVGAAGVRRIQWQRRDSSLDGALIGAAIGAIPGVYYLIADPNECTGLCAEDYAAIAAGAALGALIDRAISRRVTVFSVPKGADTVRVTIAPLIVPSVKGVRLAVRF